MKYVDHTVRSFSEMLNVPKNLEFKVLGKVIQDLADSVQENYISVDVHEHVLSDLNKARQAVRSRDRMKVASLHKDLTTRRNLLSRKYHTKGDDFAFFVAYQLESFLKKFPFSGTNTYQPAIDKFMEGENVCRLYNEENCNAWKRLSQTIHPLYGNSIEEIREDICSLLGEDFAGCSSMVDAAHGPGVAFGDLYKNGETTDYYKWRTLPYTVTRSAIPLAKSTILSVPQWIGALDDWYRSRTGNRYAPIDMQDFWSRVLKPVNGNRITTVPKSALTDRTIAIEPVLNVFMQLGVDRFIRKRLRKRWNIDINTQEHNQNLARLGSLDGSFATIDLSNASDTISLKICEMLFPAQWYGLMLDLRSPVGDLKGLSIPYEKISSMGNGFTFAIETVLFAALARHAARRDRTNSAISVFGDDIVVPTGSAASTLDLISLAGLTANKEKTFTKGPFRESCGTDWFLGTNVRPVFLKRSLRTVRDMFYVHNSLLKLESTVPWFWGLKFRHTRAYLKSLIPKKFGRIKGPPSESLDTHLFVENSSGLKKRGFHLTLIDRPRIFNKNTDFFFRKLMVTLSVSKQATNKWSERRKLSTGNSFDVTRRDRTVLLCVKRRLY